MKIRFLFNFYHYLRTPFITTSVEASVGKLAVSSFFFTWNDPSQTPLLSDNHKRKNQSH